MSIGAQPITFPETSLLGRDLLTFVDYHPDELGHLLSQSARLKAGELTANLAGKTLALFFKKHSTRTRMSAFAAMAQLGGTAVDLGIEQSQVSRGEPLQDTARVLSRYVDGLFIRTFEQAELEMWAQWADVPVINALSDMFHPCQALADLLTIMEHQGGLSGRTLTYLGDGNNVAHSLMVTGALAGMEVRLACPPGYGPDAAVYAKAKQLARSTGGAVSLIHDPEQAVRGAHAVYTDVWASMGQETEAAVRRRDLAPYQVTAALMAKASPRAIFMHCLPAHRGEEVTEQVLEGPQSVVFDQAENRLHTLKAVLVNLLGGATA